MLLFVFNLCVNTKAKIQILFYLQNIDIEKFLKKIEIVLEDMMPKVWRVLEF